MIPLGITSPIASAVARAITGAGNSFSPLSLFASGEEGAWYDPSDLSTLFQDAAGTTPVTADGQPVRLMLDKSGNGNHATAPSDAARPLYKTAGGLHWLEFDGVDDTLAIGSYAFPPSALDLAFTLDTTGVNSIPISRVASASNWIGIWQSGSSSTANGLAVEAAGFEAGTFNGLRIDGAPSGATTRGQNYTAVQGKHVHVWRYTNISETTTPTIPLSIGGYSGSFALAGDLYGLVFRQATADAGELADLEAYLAAKSGVTLP